MIFFPWTPESCIGVAVFDNEHWQLVRLINELYDGMLTGTATQKVQDILECVAGYAHLHLTHEEDAMTRTGYPDLENHRLRHDEFRATIESFRPRVREAQGTLALIDITRELATYLKQWLERHILEEDKQLGRYLNANGVH